MAKFLYGWANNNAEATARTMNTLSVFYGIKRVGEIHGAIAVMWTAPGHYKVWTLSDNGGEINVEMINQPDTLISIPYTRNGFGVTAETMAYRICCAIRGEPIDWNYLYTPGISNVEPLAIRITY